MQPVIYDFEIDALDSHELLKPNIVTPLPIRQACEVGSVVRLLCLLTGYPPLEIKWYLNGEQLIDSERVSFDNNKRELIIKDINMQDCGSVTFHAKNKYEIHLFAWR